MDNARPAVFKHDDGSSMSFKLLSRYNTLTSRRALYHENQIAAVFLVSRGVQPEFELGLPSKNMRRAIITEQKIGTMSELETDGLARFVYPCDGSIGLTRHSFAMSNIFR